MCKTLRGPRPEPRRQPRRSPLSLSPPPPAPALACLAPFLFPFRGHAPGGTEKGSEFLFPFLRPRPLSRPAPRLPLLPWSLSAVSSTPQPVDRRHCPDSHSFQGLRLQSHWDAEEAHARCSPRLAGSGPASPWGAPSPGLAVLRPQGWGWLPSRQGCFRLGVRAGSGPAPHVCSRKYSCLYYVALSY